MRMISFLAALLLAASAAAGETSVDRVKNLLAAGASASPQAVARAADEYDHLRRVVPGDTRIDYVYAVALVNQHRHHQALPLVNRYLKQYPRDLAAQRTRIFVELSLRQFDGAWNHAAALAPAFDGAPVGSASLTETARFLGTVLGYLELARGQAGDETQEAARRRLTAALGQDYFAPFDEGRQSVADRLAEFDAAEKQQADEAAAEQARRQQATTAAIEAGHEKLESGRQTLQDGTEQVRDAKRQLSVISTQMSSLMNDRAMLSAQITMVQSQYVQQQQQLANRNTMRASITDTAILNSLALSLANLNREALQLDKRILALRNEAGAADAQGRLGSETLSSSQKSVATTEAQLKLLERKAQQLEQEELGPGGAITRKRRALSTYLSFPYDAERTRLLTWLQRGGAN